MGEQVKNLLHIKIRIRLRCNGSPHSKRFANLAGENLYSNPFSL